MKKYKLILNMTLLSLLILGFHSCGNDALEEEVFDKVTSNNFFQKESDAIIGVNGIYDGLQHTGFWYRQWMLQETVPGSMSHTWNESLNTLNYTNNTGNLWVLWRQSYNVIGRANAILKALENSTLDTDAKNQLIGESRYLRGMVYFNLVRMFGHVPLVKSAPESIVDAFVPTDSIAAAQSQSEFLRQADRDDVYDFIIEDLEFAELNLPDANFSGGNEDGRVKKGAATALLGKVYLTQAGVQYNYETGNLDTGDASKWGLAASKLSELINSGNYSLQSNYDDIFLNSNENNSEVIFSIQYLSAAESGGITGEGSQFVNRTGIVRSDITPGSWRQAHSSLPFFNAWVAANGTDDNRFSRTWKTQFVNNAGETINFGDINGFELPHLWKFISNEYGTEAINGANDYGDNMIYLRYSDVLLMHSEALNESEPTPTANTLAGLNAVRQRAGKAPITLPISKSDLREAIWSERKWELVGEQHYFFDCQRTGRLLDEIIANWYEKSPGVTGRIISIGALSNKFYVLPIHFNALSSNPSLVQNHGW